MLDTIKGLLGKIFKDEQVDLAVGRHYFDDTIVVRVHGSVEKHDDQLVAPTVSIPLVTTLALFWEKAGIEKDKALALLREAISEAMDDGVDENANIKARIDDVTAAITAVRKELIDKLPKMHRAGKVVTKDLVVTVLPQFQEAAA
jgi:hypothetical protein